MALFLTRNLFVASGIDYLIYHAAVDTLGHLLALKVTPAQEQDRFGRLARDYERLTATQAAYHWLAFVSLMLNFIFPKS